MVIKIDFCGEIKETDFIPKNFDEFKDLITNFYGAGETDQFTYEYTFDDKKYYLITKDTYNNLFDASGQNLKINIFPSYEESNYYRQETENNNNIIIKEEEIKEENNNINKNPNEIKLPEITKEMVIASIVKGVKERRQQSKIQLEKEKKEKEKKEKERKKREKEKKKKEEKEKKDKKVKNDFAGEISNLIANRVENFKNELVNESKIKLNQIITESQIQLKNLNLEKNQENEKSINSLEKHPDIRCSKCGMDPIIGNRYCCMYCENVNFCEKCEDEIGFEHNHPFYKFKLRVEN